MDLKVFSEASRSPFWTLMDPLGSRGNRYSLEVSDRPLVLRDLCDLKGSRLTSRVPDAP